MTLTEEQRAAIHAVSGLLTAIGCPQCHSYLQKNYTHHIEVLRAMTDSSEHFSDATKMIGFDMEKARASIAHYRIENPSNVDTESALKELVDQANLAEDALAEIERLRGFETAARDLNNDLIRIAGERDELAARIQELEDALVEERVIGEGGFRAEQCEFWYIEDLPEESCMELDGPCDWAKCPRKHELCDVAYQQLAEEGKIGPDDSKKISHLRPYEVVAADLAGMLAKSWQITDERKAALWHAINVLKENDIMEEPEEHLWDEEVTVFQAMLTEAE